MIAPSFCRVSEPKNSPVCEDPIGAPPGTCYLFDMNLLLVLVILLLLFGGGGFYFGGPVIGGSGVGLILLVCLIVYLMGGFRTKN